MATEMGIVIDIETTGLSADYDKIIEIGIVEFIYDPKVAIPTITSSYGELEDPLEPLSQVIKKITTITDQALVGRKINWQTVQNFIDSSSVIIAHNVAFERGFLAKRPELQNLEDKIWACTMLHIPWKAMGHTSKSLNHLIGDHGFINPFAHRAVFDCAATYRLMLPYFEDLVVNSQKTHIKILAKQTAIEIKDKLKARGYQWKPEGKEGDPDKYWWTTVVEDKLEAERVFLKEEIYVDRPDYHEEVAS